MFEHSDSLSDQIEQALQEAWPVEAVRTDIHDDLGGGIGRPSGRAELPEAADDLIRSAFADPNEPAVDTAADLAPEPAAGRTGPLAFAVDRDDDPDFETEADDEFYSDYGEPPARSRRRKVLFVAAGVLGLVVIGAGVASQLGPRATDRAPSGPPPIIKAETGAVKIEPEKPAEQQQASTPGQAVYDRVAGRPEPAEDTIVNNVEEPREIARVVPPTSQADDTVGKSEERLAGLDPEQPDAEPFDPIGPRKVRTFVVKPDGTILQSAAPSPAATQAAAAPAIEGTQVAALDNGNLLQPMPVRTIDVNLAEEQAKAGSNVSAPGTPTATLPAGVAGSAPTGAAPATAGAPAETGALPAGNATAAPADLRGATEGTEEQAGAVPRPRPGEVPRVSTRPTQVASVGQAATRGRSGPIDLLNPGATQAAKPAAAKAAAAASSSDGYVVQVSSQRSAEQAQASFDALKARYGSVLGSYRADIQRADVADKGTYYRVRVGPMASRDEAIQLCEQLKAAGGNCFVTR
ncbi:SPOR domain-containing protein [Rhizobiales bacterium L72]|uniref:SPOR domain-containing protein n=2 Tax=Propylenella binzhouense TaxID=2555902 RepID=A0A964WSY4_9HYPH|nr:SPOR domain-containing protein [Propylenella binzhouense]